MTAIADAAAVETDPPPPPVGVGVGRREGDRVGVVPEWSAEGVPTAVAVDLVAVAELGLWAVDVPAAPVPDLVELPSRVVVTT